MSSWNESSPWGRGWECLKSMFDCYFSFRGWSLEALWATWKKSGDAAPGRDKVLLITAWYDTLTGRIMQHLLSSAAHETRSCSMSVQGAVFVLFAICTCTYSCLSRYSRLSWVNSEKGCLHEIPIRRFSICSGVLLLGALKRPTEPAKNQSATM